MFRSRWVTTMVGGRCTISAVRRGYQVDAGLEEASTELDVRCVRELVCPVGGVQDPASAGSVPGRMAALTQSGALMVQISWHAADAAVPAVGRWLPVSGCRGAINRRGYSLRASRAGHHRRA